jgi:hypothetical protein
MSDILISAKAHDWYAHDETLGEELIDEIERLRTNISALERACAGYVEVIAAQDAELKKLKHPTDDAVADNCAYLDDNHRSNK